MKRIFTFLAAALLTVSVFAQSPEKMSYQAVVRNSSNQLVTNQSVGMHISILQGSASGTVVYTETQTHSTNANGLVSIEIGGGAGFSTIDWANGSFFIKTETDPTGGTNYTITGTSQILSVPYALHAKTAESVTISGNETVFDNWDKIHSDDVLLKGDQYIRGRKIFQDSIWATGIGLPYTFGPDVNYVGDKGAYIGFGHSGFSEDFIGYKKNTFYLKDSPGGGDISDPNLVVGGRIGIGIEEPVEKLEVEGNIDIHNNTLKNLSNPVNDQDAATKKYVDDKTAGATTYSIGLNNDLGGYVFYVAPGGNHGLVAAWNDQENDVDWYGAQNVISNPENHYPAGRKYTDWRLPTKYELNLMYAQKTTIGGFSNNFYWSSTESDYDKAFSKDFNSGNSYGHLKINTFRVRAVRSF